MIVRVAAAAALAGALMGASVVAPARATTVAPSRTELPNDVPVALQRVGAGLLLLTDHPGTAAAQGVHGKLQARAGVVSGAVLHWAAPVDLSGAWQVYGDSVRTSTASNGLTAIAWDGIDTSQVDPQDQSSIAAGTGQAVVIVVRLQNGTWQGPYSTSQLTRVSALTSDGAGDVAVLGDDARGHQRTLVRTSAGDWSVVRSGRLRLQSIQLDGNGLLHGVLHDAGRGGSGTVSLTRLTPGATTWSTPRRVRPAGQRVHQVQLLVSDAGQETLVVGTDSARWRSTYDGRRFFATAYQVLQREHGRFVRVWQREGAQQLAAALGPDGRLQLVWVQDRRPNRRLWPTRFGLLTQQLAPTAGPVTTVTSGPTYRSDGARHGVGAASVFLGPAAANGGVGVLWTDAGSRHVWWNGTAAVLPTTLTTPTTPTTPAPAEPGSLGALGAMTTAPVVAWVSASTQDGQGASTSATTSVAVLLP